MAARDYEVEEKLIASLKRRNGVATAGDLVTDTGLAYDTVERELRHMLETYRSHLDVDESGNLRYRFDPNFERRGEEAGRVLYKIWSAVRSGARWFFKAWIMLMLVGYTTSFVLILLAAALGAIGLTMASGDDGGEGLGELGFLPLYAMIRVLEFMFWISLFSGPDSGFFGRRMKKRKRKRPEKPFYRKVYDYVLGPEEARTNGRHSQRFFATLVRSHGGVLTSADWVKRTGHSLDRARELLTACALRFRGEVDMADDGTLLYRFDELQVSADAGGRELEPPRPIWEEEKQLAPLTGNKRSSNVWISILNGFNLGMGAYVVFGLPAAIGATAVTALGWIPLAFSGFVYAVPLVRRLRRGKERRRVARENRWRRTLPRVFEAAENGEALPATEVPDDLHERLMSELSAESEMDGEGNIRFRFPQLEAELAFSRSARESVSSEDVSFGKSVFSSEDDAEAMDDQAQADFDARLERELAR